MNSALLSEQQVDNSPLLAGINREDEQFLFDSLNSH